MRAPASRPPSRWIVVGALVATAGCAQALGVEGDYQLDPTPSGSGAGAQGAGAQGAGGPGGGGAMGCPADPTPPGGACPAECTGGCEGGLCNIDCVGTACTSITCPERYRCAIDCRADDACRDVDIACGEFGCDITCEGSFACDGTAVTCGAGACTLACNQGPNVCRDATLSCGAGACEATCGTNSTPAVQCNDACDCTTC